MPRVMAFSGNPFGTIRRTTLRSTTGTEPTFDTAMEPRLLVSASSTVQYSTVHYSAYSTVQYSTVQYSTVQHSTVQYCVCVLWPLLVWTGRWAPLHGTPPLPGRQKVLLPLHSPFLNFIFPPPFPSCLCRHAGPLAEHRLFLSGQRVFLRVLAHLTAHHGLASATHALLSGHSAGGLAALLHCDQFADIMSALRGASLAAMSGSEASLAVNGGSGASQASPAPISGAPAAPDFAEVVRTDARGVPKPGGPARGGAGGVQGVRQAGVRRGVLGREQGGFRGGGEVPLGCGILPG